MLYKFTSRKFLAAVAGVIIGLCMAFGLDDNTVNVVSGAVTSVVSIVAYIVAEGKVDAAAVKDAIEDVQEAIEVIQNDNKSSAD